MKKNLLICLLLLFGSLHIGLQAKDFDITIENSTDKEYIILIDSISRDSLPKLEIKEEINPYNLIKPEFKPNPTKAVIYSAIFPGLGQAYNRKYWKLPIVYGGFLGVVYAFTWNGRYYSDYADAFSDLALGKGDSWKDFLPNASNDIQFNPQERQRYQDLLKRKRDFYRRYRDLSIIVGAGLYVLCMIDAYVDAQLFDFDMSEDLSMTVAPMVWTPNSISGTTVGVQFRIVF
ncbi:DUF5683 domain-containing protein [Dysgonomonas massiliensis]|uniref:DUF5683 domain-containing protein n=1 Tax=Dysgonomonas massiliensis TaxID=2040292 RepID=UPI000C7682CF|nr:DUF5683 domain-containing protein [Dysgonomonas massiliensis]